MPVDVIMPSLGFDMTEGTLARWLVREGERVERGQAIAEIETEKATVEIEASVSGVLSKIVVPPGKTVPVGTVIGTIDGADEKPAGKAPGPPAEETAGRPPEGAAGKAAEGAEEAPPSAEAAGARKIEAEAKQAKDAGPVPSDAAAGHPPEPAPPPAEGRVKASPVARRMAQEAGLDLSRIRGTGPDGRVMERDVKAALASKAAPAPAQQPVPPAPPEAPAPAPAPPAPPESRDVPLNRIRQATARRMVESKTTAPHFYVTIEVDMDEAVRMREQMNRVAPAGEKISINDFVVAAAARTLAQFPALNASWQNGTVKTHSRVNIGIAVALEEGQGLVTPVLKEADGKPLKKIAAEARALAQRAREGKLRADDVGFGTFTVSNLGMFDVDEFIAIINPPEAAILAVGAVTRRPVAAGDAVRIGNVMRATLSVDHRVADGAQAGRFLQEFRKLLENPVNLLTG